MPRFRIKRTAPRLSGTSKKHGHDSLHLLETARVKVNKARVRLPDSLTTEEYTAVAEATLALHADVVALGIRAARKNRKGT